MAFRRKKSSQPESVDPNTPPPGQNLPGAEPPMGEATAPETEDQSSVAVAVLPGVPLPSWASRMPLTGQLLAAQDHLSAGQPIAGGPQAAPMSPATQQGFEQTPAATNLLPPPSPMQRSEEAPGPVFYEETPGSPPQAGAIPTETPQWTQEAATPPPAAPIETPQWTQEAPTPPTATSTEEPQRTGESAPVESPPQWGFGTSPETDSPGLTPMAAEPEPAPEPAASAPQWIAETVTPQSVDPNVQQGPVSPAGPTQPGTPDPAQRTDKPLGPVVHGQGPQGSEPPVASNQLPPHQPASQEPTTQSGQTPDLVQPQPVSEPPEPTGQAGPPSLQSYSEATSTLDQQAPAPQWDVSAPSEEGTNLPPGVEFPNADLPKAPLPEAEPKTPEPTFDKLAQGRPDPVPQTPDPGLAWFTDMPGATNPEEEPSPYDPFIEDQQPKGDTDPSDESPIEWSSDFETDFPPTESDDLPFGGPRGSSPPAAPGYPGHGAGTSTPPPPSDEPTTSPEDDQASQDPKPQGPTPQWPPAAPNNDPEGGPTSRYGQRPETNESDGEDDGESAIVDLRDPLTVNSELAHSTPLAIATSTVSAGGSHSVTDQSLQKAFPQPRPPNKIGADPASPSITIEPAIVISSAPEDVAADDVSVADSETDNTSRALSLTAGQPPLDLPITRPLVSDSPGGPLKGQANSSKPRKHHKRLIIGGTVLVAGCLAAAALWVDAGQVGTEADPVPLAALATPVTVGGLTQSEGFSPPPGLVPALDPEVVPISTATYSGDGVQATVWMAPSGINSTVALFESYQSTSSTGTQPSQSFSPGIRGGVLDCGAIDATRTICYWGNAGMQGGAEIAGLNRTRAAELVSQMRTELEPR